MCLLISGTVNVFDHEDEKFPFDVELLQSFKKFFVIQSALANILFDVRQRPPYPIQFLVWQKDQCSKLTGLDELLTPQFPIDGKGIVKMGYDGRMGHERGLVERGYQAQSLLNACSVGAIPRVALTE